MEHKTKKRFNVIDVVLILLVVALIATIVYRVYAGISNDKKTGSGQYILTFECESEYDVLTKYLSNGEYVYFAADGGLLGRLYDSDLTDSVEAVYEIKAGDAPGGEDAPQDDSESKLDSSLGYKKVKLGGQIKLNGETVKSKNGAYYVVGEINLTEGSVIEVYTNDTEFTLRVVTISVAE